MFLNAEIVSKPGTYMRLVSWNHYGLHIGMHFCVSTLKGINNQWLDMVWYGLIVCDCLNTFYAFFHFSVPLYDTSYRYNG